MILVCPSCDTRYFADDSAIGNDGRRVRCVSCGHSWFAKMQEEGAPPAPAEDTGLTREQVERLRQTAAANSAARAGPHAEYRAREHARRKRERSRASIIAWGVGFVVFVGAVTAAIVFRNEIANAFPRTASLYRMVGLEVNRFGLALEEVDAKRSFDGTTPVLTVTGAAVNRSDEPREAPKLRVVLRDEAGKQVKEWTDQLSVTTLGPGERVEFSSRFEAPPVETYRLTVTFAPLPGDAPASDGTTLASGDIKQEGAAGDQKTAEGSGGPAGAEGGAPDAEAEPVKQEADHN
jgi:predicted Zn finger-like uncharacterized protein